MDKDCLAGAKLLGFNFNKANLAHYNFSNADLRGANLTGANLSGCNLTDCRFDNLSILASCNMRGAYVIAPDYQDGAGNFGCVDFDKNADIDQVIVLETSNFKKFFPSISMSNITLNEVCI